MEKNDSTYCKCLYYSANALARIMTKMADEAFASTGLSSSYAFLLMTVNRKPGIRPKEISEHMQLTPSTITRLVEKMEHKGLIERKSVGKFTEVHPTNEGRKLYHPIKEAWASLYQDYSKMLGKEEGDELTAAIYEASKKLEQ